MTFADFHHIRTYLKKKIEIHLWQKYVCQIPTGLTTAVTPFPQNTKVEIEDGYYKKPIETAYQDILMMKKLYKGRDDKYIH